MFVLQHSFLHYLGGKWHVLDLSKLTIFHEHKSLETAKGSWYIDFQTRSNFFRRNLRSILHDSKQIAFFDARRSPDLNCSFRLNPPYKIRQTIFWQFEAGIIRIKPSEWFCFCRSFKSNHNVNLILILKFIDHKYAERISFHCSSFRHSFVNKTSIFNKFWHKVDRCKKQI